MCEDVQALAVTNHLFLEPPIEHVSFISKKTSLLPSVKIFFVDT